MLDMAVSITGFLAIVIGNIGIRIGESQLCGTVTCLFFPSSHKFTFRCNYVLLEINNRVTVFEIT